MNTLRVKWTGIRPLICHNGYLADRLNPIVPQLGEAITQIRSARGRSVPALEEQRDWLEWQGGIYWDATEGPVIPADNIEKCIKDGAKKARLGKAVEACVFCADLVVPIEYDGPRDMQKMYADPSQRFMFRKGIRVGQGRIIRVRPMFPPGWSLAFDVEYDETIVSPTSLKKAMLDAGAWIGLGDWRPKFGRFLVEYSQS